MHMYITSIQYWLRSCNTHDYPIFNEYTSLSKPNHLQSEKCNDLLNLNKLGAVTKKDNSSFHKVIMIGLYLHIYQSPFASSILDNDIILSKDKQYEISIIICIQT